MAAASVVQTTTVWRRAAPRAPPSAPKVVTAMIAKRDGEADQRLGADIAARDEHRRRHRGIEDDQQQPRHQGRDAPPEAERDEPLEARTVGHRPHQRGEDARSGTQSAAETSQTTSESDPAMT